MLNWLKEKLAKLVIPSSWVAWLNGKKRLLGLIQLALWALIFGLPAIKPEWVFLAAIGTQIQHYMQAFGVNIGSELLASGAGFTIIGLLDWISKHIISDLTVAGLKKVEAPVVKLVSRKEE
jgi:uncharacterized membrane protein